MTTQDTTDYRRRHLAPQERRQLGRAVRELYETGLSIRQLRDAYTGLSFGRMRRLLLDAGTTLRPVYQRDRFHYTPTRRAETDDHEEAVDHVAAM